MVCTYATSNLCVLTSHLSLQSPKPRRQPPRLDSLDRGWELRVARVISRGELGGRRGGRIRSRGRLRCAGAGVAADAGKPVAGCAGGLGEGEGEREGER